MRRFLSSGGGALVVLGVLAWLLASGSALSSAPPVVAAQLAAIVLTVWARRTFAVSQFRAGAEPGAGPLLAAGPYRYVRHPMYAAALLLVWACVLGHWSVVNALAGAVVTAVIAARIPVEEQLLRTRYPEYEAYAARTRRLVPFLL